MARSIATIAADDTTPLAPDRPRPAGPASAAPTAAGRTSTCTTSTGRTSTGRAFTGRTSAGGTAAGRISAGGTSSGATSAGTIAAGRIASGTAGSARTAGFWRDRLARAAAALGLAPRAPLVDLDSAPDYLLRDLGFRDGRPVRPDGTDMRDRPWRA